MVEEAVDHHVRVLVADVQAGPIDGAEHGRHGVALVHHDLRTLADDPLYRWLTIAQVGGYAALAFAYAIQHRVRLPKLVRMPLFLVSLNCAFLVGFWRWLAGGQGGTWTRTARGAKGS